MSIASPPARLTFPSCFSVVDYSLTHLKGVIGIDLLRILPTDDNTHKPRRLLFNHGEGENYPYFCG
jgi:hypothetical protein